MTALQIIVPVTHNKLHLLEDCLRSVKSSTPFEHVVNLVVGKAHLEDCVGEVVAMARSIYDRTGLVVTVADPADGYNGMVAAALEASDSTYTAVLPVTHRICDREWFGKMQLPLIRAPGCGMTSAPDEIPANTNGSYPALWKVPVPSQFFMLSRAVMKLAAETPIDRDDTDLSSSVRDHLRAAATTCWIVPSCRVERMHAEW